VEILEDSLMLVFTLPAETVGLAEGDIVVGAEDGGYLRWVDSAEFNGNTVLLQTSPATLSEAIEEGEVELDLPLEFGAYGGGGDGDDVPLPFMMSLQGISLFDGSVGGVPLEVETTDGYIHFTPSLHIWAYKESGILPDYFEGWVSGELDFSIDLKATAGGSFSHSGEILLYGQTIAIYYPTPWPVGGTASLALYAGFEVSAAAEGSVEAGLDYSTDTKVGAVYDDDQFDYVFEHDVQGSFHQPSWNVEGTVAVTGYVRPEVSLKLYGAAGPVMDLKPYLKFLGDFLPPPPCWSILAGITGSVKFVLKVWKFGIESPPWTFLDYEKTLKTGCLCWPKTCGDLGKECGSWDDDCGGSVDCGTCGQAEDCVSGTCLLNCNEYCAGNGKNCDWYGECNCGSCGPGCTCVNNVCSLECQVCGDGNCTGSENCNDCFEDCGPCVTCPNGACDNGESCASCPQDCGVCCPNGACDNGETCATCTQDCGVCCPNGACDYGENCTTCPQDCGDCPPECGNGQCDGAENCNNCLVDCGQCCGNGNCDVQWGETAGNCPQDCDECQPSSTCCSAQGSHVPDGQNGPGCQGECKQCDGFGGCESKANGTVCANGQKSCSDGNCETVTLSLLMGGGEVELGEEVTVSCFSWGSAATSHDFAFFVMKGDSIIDQTVIEGGGPWAKWKATPSLAWSPEVSVQCRDETLSPYPLSEVKNMAVVLPLSISPNPVAAGQTVTFMCELSAEGGGHQVDFFVQKYGGPVGSLGAWAVNAAPDGTATLQAQSKMDWKPSVTVVCRDGSAPDPKPDSVFKILTVQ